MRAFDELLFPMALPTEIDPRKLASQGTCLAGDIDQKALTRVHDAVENVLGPLKVEVGFRVDESGAAIADGKLRLDVMQICQRCLEPMRNQIESSFGYQIIWSDEQIANVPVERDSWIVRDRLADLLEILEDEVLLALPITSHHQDGKCTALELAPSKFDVADQIEKHQENPFNVLKKFKV